MEPNFIMFKSLKPLYEKVVATNKITLAEFPNKSANSHLMSYMPNCKLMVANKNNQIINELINHLHILISNDYTNQINIENSINNWLYSNVESNKINYVDGAFIGVKDSDNKIILLDRLMSSHYLDLNKKSYCLYIPANELLTRQAYNWFVYLNSKEVLESNTNIGKYLLFSNNN